MPNTGFKQVTRATRTWIDDTGTQCAWGRHLNPLPPEEIAAIGRCADRGGLGSADVKRNHYRLNAAVKQPVRTDEGLPCLSPCTAPYCPYDCPDTCGLLVAVEESRAVKVSGDPDHPYTRGTLCPKMNRYPDTVYSPLRLTEPLERCGPKGDAQFRPISWAAAIDTIATRWRHIIATSGAEAILPYSYAGTMGLVQRNAGHPFFHRLGASLLDRTICAPAMGLGWDAVMGKTPAPRPEAVRNCDLIILWGINAAATNVHFLKDVRAALKQGAKVWLIETYRTPTVAIAQRTFIVRPGSDGALALGLMHLLDRNGSCHHDFLRDHVQGL